MALLSPGVQVTVTDKSMYTSGSVAKTVPLFIIATKYGKLRPNSNLVARGTLEAGVPRLITSLRDSIELYGIPKFYRDAYDQPLHGDCRNEYGLFALNQYLKLGNRAFVIRADIDLDDDVENLQYLWEVATSTITDKAKSLFNTALARVQEASGDLNKMTMGGFEDLSALYDMVEDANGDITIGAKKYKYVLTAAERIAKLKKAQDYDNQNETLAKVIKEAVSLLPTITSTFAEKYSSPDLLKYNIQSILNENFYDVPVFKSYTETDGARTYSYTVKDYVDYVDPSSDSVYYNVLRADRARYAHPSFRTSGATISDNKLSPVNDTLSLTNVFLGLVGELFTNFHASTIGGYFTSVNDTLQLNSYLTNVATNAPYLNEAKTVTIECDITSVTPEKDTNGQVVSYLLGVQTSLLIQDKVSSPIYGSANFRYTLATTSTPAKVEATTNLVFDSIIISGQTFTFNMPKSDTKIVVSSLANIRIKTVAGVKATGINVTEFSTALTSAMQKYGRTDALYYTTHPFGAQQMVSSLPNSGKDTVRRLEIIKKLAQVVRSNTTTNMDLDVEFSDTADLTSDAYEFNVILCPGYPELADEMLDLCNQVKQEAFVIADTPMDKSVRDVIRWGQALDENTVMSAYNVIRSDNRGLIAYYYPHGLDTNIDGHEVMCAASGLALSAFTFNDNVAYTWSAPAGPNRGVLSQYTTVSKVGYVSGDLGTSNVKFNSIKLTEPMRDALYSMCNINPILDSRQYGIMVLGQKTRVNVDFNSALDRINVARMVMYIRRGLRKLLFKFVMEPNTSTLRKLVESTATGYLNDIKTKDGLYDFAVLCDDSNNTPDDIDRNQLFISCALKPVKSIEFIYCDITLVKTGDPLTF